MFEILMINGKGTIALIWTSWLGFLAWLLGGFDLLVQVLAILMLIDYATGLIVGYKEKKLNSKRAYRGIRKKLLIWIIISSATLLTYVTGLYWIREVTATFYVATEILSIIENAAKFGVPIPEQLKKALEQCKNKDFH